MGWGPLPRQLPVSLWWWVWLFYNVKIARVNVICPEKGRNNQIWCHIESSDLTEKLNVHLYSFAMWNKEVFGTSLKSFCWLYSPARKQFCWYVNIVLFVCNSCKTGFWHKMGKSHWIPAPPWLNSRLPRYNRLVHTYWRYFCRIDHQIVQLIMPLFWHIYIVCLLLLTICLLFAHFVVE